MASDFSLEITYKGVKGAQNALAQFPEELDSVIKEHLDDLGEQVYSEMTSLVPVDTGELRDSIGYTVSGEGELNFEATADYAGFVEYGTTRMVAQPYFNPPLDKLRSEGIGSKFGEDALSNWYSLISQYENQ